MKYENIIEGTFISRPNRFIAHVEIEGKEEIVHVKNTGRCKELLVPGAKVFLERVQKEERKTGWDLISVKKGERIINMDSQIPSKVVKEWLESGNLIPTDAVVRQEVTYQASRFDLYAESGERKIFIEVKGVTLEREDIVKFPDAPSARAIKHVEELCEAVKAGYEAYVFFVVQLSGAKYFTPNQDTHPEFLEALKKAKASGVKLIAYECYVRPKEIYLTREVPIILEEPPLYEIVWPLIEWYRENKRDLPWRKHIKAYHIWVSEIMLQQTRVEAVKPYYERFLSKFPTIKDLAEAKEDELLKLWEGLGYYNRVRNMQKAARQIVKEYDGQFPDTYDQIRGLKGIGSYTAGAISSIAYGIPKPAVDGNVLRVISRILSSEKDIAKASVKSEMEKAIEEIIPQNFASDFNQGLIELGAIICVPNSAPRCEICPVQRLCKARAEHRQLTLPVKTKMKERRVEKHTILLFRDGDTLALKKRPSKGLLAGLYEFPSVEGHLTIDEVVRYSKKIGLTPIYVKPLTPAKHIFSHIEWDMVGYAVQVDELEKSCKEKMLFIHPKDIEKKYPIPAAFEAYRS